jgi:hypothetical protein
MLLVAVAWAWLLGATGHKISVRESSIVFGVSQFAKYLPGNVAHHIGRVALAAQRQIPISDGALVTATEMALQVLVGGFLSLTAIASLRRAIDFAGLDPTRVAVVVGVTLPILLGSAVLVRRRLRSNAVLRRILNATPLVLMGRSVLLYVVNFALLGLTLHWILIGVFAGPDIGLSKTIGVFAVAWLLGYLTPGAPAGIGVRELVLVLLLTPGHGSQLATAAALCLRVVTTLGDGLVFIACFTAYHRLAANPTLVDDVSPPASQ